MTLLVGRVNSLRLASIVDARPTSTLWPDLLQMYRIPSVKLPIVKLGTRDGALVVSRGKKFIAVACSLGFETVEVLVQASDAGRIAQMFDFPKFRSLSEVMRNESSETFRQYFLVFARQLNITERATFRRKVRLAVSPFIPEAFDFIFVEGLNSAVYFRISFPPSEEKQRQFTAGLLSALAEFDQQDVYISSMFGSSFNDIRKLYST